MVTADSKHDEALNDSRFYSFSEVFRNKPDLHPRYPYWSKSTAYAGIKKGRFVPPKRVAGRIYFEERDLLLQDRLIRLASELVDIDLPPLLASEVQCFHFSREGLLRIADSVAVEKIAAEARDLSQQCTWLLETIEQVLKTKSSSFEANHVL